MRENAPILLWSSKLRPSIDPRAQSIELVVVVVLCVCVCVCARARVCMCVYRQLVSGRDLIRASKALQPAPDAGPSVHITVDRRQASERSAGGGVRTQWAEVRGQGRR